MMPAARVSASAGAAVWARTPEAAIKATPVMAATRPMYRLITASFMCMSPETAVPGAKRPAPGFPESGRPIVPDVALWWRAPVRRSTRTRCARFSHALIEPCQHDRDFGRHYAKAERSTGISSRPFRGTLATTVDVMRANRGPGGRRPRNIADRATEHLCRTRVKHPAPLQAVARYPSASPSSSDCCRRSPTSAAARPPARC